MPLSVYLQQPPNRSPVSTHHLCAPPACVLPQASSVTQQDKHAWTSVFPQCQCPWWTVRGKHTWFAFLPNTWATPLRQPRQGVTLRVSPQHRPAGHTGGRRFPPSASRTIARFTPLHTSCALSFLCDRFSVKNLLDRRGCFLTFMCVYNQPPFRHKVQSPAPLAMNTLPQQPPSAVGVTSRLCFLPTEECTSVYVPS